MKVIELSSRFKTTKENVVAEDFYASAYPIHRAGGIVFSGCLCARSLPTYIPALWEVFPTALAVDGVGF